MPALVATALAPWYQADAPRPAPAIVGVLVLWSLVSLGGLLDGRRWAVFAEVGRVAAVVVGMVALT